VVRDRDGSGREGVSWKRKSSSQFSVGVAVEKPGRREVGEGIRQVLYSRWMSDEDFGG
jgi:hypothetical protein